jgi:hypothetical protein
MNISYSGYVALIEIVMYCELEKMDYGTRGLIDVIPTSVRKDRTN